MPSLAEAIERNRVRVRYQYPQRLPLPRYKAWEVLTDALAHLDGHGVRIAPDVLEFEHPGDWEAVVLLRNTRMSLCTPATR